MIIPSIIQDLPDLIIFLVIKDQDDEFEEIGELLKDSDYIITGQILYLQSLTDIVRFHKTKRPREEYEIAIVFFLIRTDSKYVQFVHHYDGEVYVWNLVANFDSKSYYNIGSVFTWI